MLNIRKAYRDAGIICFCVVFGSFMAEVHAYAPESFEGDLFKDSCSKGLDYLTGTGLASLLTAVAGLGAIVSAAVGGFRMAWALIVVSAGSYILSDFIQGDEVKWFTQGSCG